MRCAGAEDAADTKAMLAGWNPLYAGWNGLGVVMACPPYVLHPEEWVEEVSAMRAVSRRCRCLLNQTMAQAKININCANRKSEQAIMRLQKLLQAESEDWTRFVPSFNSIDSVQKKRENNENVGGSGGWMVGRIGERIAR